jgi:hypothetical protein
LSAVLRERFESAGGREEVHIKDFDELCNAARPLPGGPLEAVDRILLYVANNAEFVGADVALIPHRDYPIGYAQHHGEFINLIEQIAVPLGYLHASGKDPITVHVATKGWERLQLLRAQRRERRQAFVAMWFKPDMNSAFNEGIVPALEACGYKPIRIDREEHNDKIDDQIIATIRKSGLMVADFTGQRGGVYYEAGFAQGLGVPVVWSCHSDHASSLHFDTRQYNHILWATAAELREKLQARIEATLPIYPTTIMDS